MKSRFIGGYKGIPRIEDEIDILEQMGYDYYADEIEICEIEEYPFEADDAEFERLIEREPKR